MKNFIKIITISLLIFILYSCNNSKINDTWKGYELGGGIPPSSWYIKIDGNRINAIHVQQDLTKENYNGTINLIKVENNLTSYKVVLDFGSGLGGIIYTLKFANNKGEYFGLADNSSNSKFEAIMEPIDANGGVIYLERKK